MKTTLTLLGLLAAPALAQTTTVSYVLEDVWLDPDITHPWESAQPMSGTFEWTYTPGDFDNGSGEFVEIDLPWFGSDLTNLGFTIEPGQIEVVLLGNWHDWGVDVTLRLAPAFSLDQPAPIDLATSKFEIEVVGINRQGHFLSGRVVPVSPFSTYCFGDGTGAACPCGNVGDVGQGCGNSGGQGGLLAAGGTGSVGADDLTFAASYLLASQPALLFCGDAQVNAGLGNPLGDGLLCVGGGIVRLQIAVPDAGGNADWGPGLGSHGAWAVGQTRNFQCWYRDPSGGPCASGYNLTNAVTVLFTP